MIKSILVIDTPRDCSKCDLKDGYFCGKTKRWIDEDDFPKPDWCPLREFPEKKEEKQYLNRKDNRGNIETYGESRDMLAVGWNMCIDEILKGVNGNE